jgi:anaerobic selenocysteine-containing dehydrogenase
MHQIDPRRIELADFACLHLQHNPGTDVALFNAMAHVIIREGWLNKAFIDERTEGYEAMVRGVAEWPPERAALISGVAAEDIVEAARLYAQARNPGSVGPVKVKLVLIPFAVCQPRDAEME